MTSGICEDCQACWSSKCHKCRNTFFEEKTETQRQCRHVNLTVTQAPIACPYSGCTYPISVDALQAIIEGK